MIDQSRRTAILELHKQGHSIRAVAKAFGVSRDTVDTIIKSGSSDVPRIERKEFGEQWREEILALHVRCKGNLVRVHEELVLQGAGLSYQALTGFCRRHGIGYEPPKPAGRYEFAPGEEMQHDTSPHKVEIGGIKKELQVASLVLCFSRMIFFQFYAAFTRFECKLFLTAALKYFGGAASRCMIDNTHVVVLRGTGANMVPVPEMAVFAERLGFVFVAHEKGDANRSARVENPFCGIERNFEAGRTFNDWDDLNLQARNWCDKKNAAPSRKLHASRRELFATELVHLKPLPIWVPEVYVLHYRIADIEGYVSVRCNRYSVPYALIGRRLEVRELDTRIEVYDGPRLVATHKRVVEPRDKWVTDPKHRPQRGSGRKKSDPTPEELELINLVPELLTYVTQLKKCARGSRVHALRRLLKLVQDYPRAPLLSALHRAEQYGLFDIDRIERMVLKQIATEYFIFSAVPEDGKEHDHE